jgi:hypothetical protein
MVAARAMDVEEFADDPASVGGGAACDRPPRQPADAMNDSAFSRAIGPGHGVDRVPRTLAVNHIPLSTSGVPADARLNSLTMPRASSDVGNRTAEGFVA